MRIKWKGNKKEKPEEHTPHPSDEASSFLMLEKQHKEHMKALSKDAETDIKKILKSPEQYIEINMIRKRRVVDTFFIFAEKKSFKYRNLVYAIDEDIVYLIPKRGGYFVATCYYKEGRKSPVNFKQTNKGITGKAMTLLYKQKLYQSLLHIEKNSLNIIIVILLIATMVMFAIGVWLMIAPAPDPPALVPALIMPWRL